MSENLRTAKVVDEIIRFAAGGTFIISGLLAPGSVIGLQKPLYKLLKHLDEREIQREIKRIVYYMKQQGYLIGEYEHGLDITDKARKRYCKMQELPRSIEPQEKWDKWWRLVIYDIPEEKKSARKAMQWHMRRYGCFQLQRSVLITPFPCLEDVEKIASFLNIDKYVTFFEAQKLSNQKILLNRFQKKYPQTKF